MGVILGLMLFSYACSFILFVFILDLHALLWVFALFYSFSFDFLSSTLDKIRDTKQPIGQNCMSLAFVL